MSFRRKQWENYSYSPSFYSCTLDTVSLSSDGEDESLQSQCHRVLKFGTNKGFWGSLLYPRGWLLEGWFKTLWFDLSLLILDGNFNKNYRLPLKRLYGGRIFKNQDFRKEEVEKWVAGSTSLQSKIIMEVEDYGLKKSMLCSTLAHPAYKHLNGIAFSFKVVYWRVIIRPSQSSSDNDPPAFRDIKNPANNLRIVYRCGKGNGAESPCMSQ